MTRTAAADCYGRGFERKPPRGVMGSSMNRGGASSRADFLVVPTVNGGKIHSYRSTDSNNPGPIGVDWINYNYAKNGEKHKTDKYYCMNLEHSTLVVRRGQPISFLLKCSRKFNMKNDRLSFVFKFTESEDASFGNNTLVAVPLLAKPKNGDGQWSAYLMKTGVADDPTVISIRVTAPSNCLVGKWHFDVDTRFESQAASLSAGHAPFYILFNPWCPTDEVYMDEAELRDEYVLNEEGLMWRGSYNRQKVVPWVYGQFQQNILESSFNLLLRVQRLALVHCGDPIRVCRTMSAAVNAPDDLGVLQGNWTEDFSGGTPPVNWLGSVDILNQFMKSGKPVKYGQCWVFAGVITTACRALGIPCRPVTAYSAAHDTQSSLTIDYLVDENGKVMDEMQKDTIWNYHVWNEVWMARPDLGTLDRGWQVIDATPQELSDGQFRCGPANVDAIRNGDVRAPYDTAFVYSEVNADKVYWRYNGVSQPLKMLRKDAEAVGKLIVTKSAGKWAPENITKKYKYPEASSEERSIMHKALKQNESVFSRYYLNEEFNEIKFDFILNDDITVGDKFKVAIQITNKGHKDYLVNVILRVVPTNYTGKEGKPISDTKHQVLVYHDPGSNVEYVNAEMSYYDYADYVKNENAFVVTCYANVADTDYEYYAEDDFRVRKPMVAIEFVNQPTLMKEVKAALNFINPLPIPLKNGKFFVASSTLPKTLELKVGKVIGPSEIISVPFSFTPKTPGKQVISAKFTSKQLQDVDGYRQFMV